jgi:hypothetical protein
MSLPAGSIRKLLHLQGRWQPFFPETPAAIPSASNSTAENDWVAPERHVEIVDVVLAVCLPISLTSYPLAAPETKFGEARCLLMVFFGAPVYMLPPVFDVDTIAVC